MDLCENVKDQVYVDNLQSIEALKTNIRREIDEIEPQLCGNVIGNLFKRILVYKSGCSEHLSKIIFHS